jgi:hypothetical protein
MKAFLLAVVGATAIAAGAFFALSFSNEDSWRVNTRAESVRVGEPGHNLVVQESGYSRREHSRE